jgi:hypothetical protein
MNKNQCNIILLATFSALYSNVDENSIQSSQTQQTAAQRMVKDIEFNHRSDSKFSQSPEGQECSKIINDFIKVLETSPKELETLRPHIESASAECIQAAYNFDKHDPSNCDFMHCIGSVIRRLTVQQQQPQLRRRDGILKNAVATEEKYRCSRWSN